MYTVAVNVQLLIGIMNGWYTDSLKELSKGCVTMATRHKKKLDRPCYNLPEMCNGHSQMNRSHSELRDRCKRSSNTR